jgi:Polysulphide reductase, NrfD
MATTVPKFTHADSSAAEREARLQQIRREALQSNLPTGVMDTPGAAPVATAKTGYYGLPVLKTPAWTWEIPIYFFVGGAAGAAAIISAVGKWTNAKPELIRDARWIAAVGGMVSPGMLVSDLGYPSRFLNMLRVFKLQSPMSMGSWTLMAFSSSAAAGAFISALERKRPSKLRVFQNPADIIAALSGTVLATYTGVLIGATAVPVWHDSISFLPAHFALSGLATASSILELLGHEAPALNALALSAAAGETLIGSRIELDKRPSLNPLRRGKSGWMTRIGGVLSGPVPLVLRFLAGRSKRKESVRLRRIAAISAIAGSFITRRAWIAAGRESTLDPQVILRPSENGARHTI